MIFQCALTVPHIAQMCVIAWWGFRPPGKLDAGTVLNRRNNTRGFAMGLLGAYNTIQGAPGACANKRPAGTGLLGYVFNSCRPAFKLDKLSIDTDIPVFPYWEWHCRPPFLGFTTLEPCARYSRRAMRWPLWGGAVFLCCGLIIA